MLDMDFGMCHNDIMVKLKKTKISLVSLTVVLLLSVIFTGHTYAINYSAYCVSQTCRDAADAEAKANSMAESAQAAADTLTGAIEALDAEISSLQAKIKTNEAIAADLQSQIIANEAKLKQQQNALVELLVNMHFDNSDDAITILAGSESISDLAEKQSRQETVKQEVVTSSEQIKNTKAELEEQKAGVDQIIAEAESDRRQIAQKRSDQVALKEKYQDNAEEYSAYAAEQRRIKQEEIANEIASRNKSGVVVTYDGLDSYYYRGSCPAGLDNWNNLWFGSPYQCECTDYAGWKMYQYTGYSVQTVMGFSGASVTVRDTIGYSSATWGNAKYWAVAARALGHNYSQIGFHVDRVPAANTIGVQTDGITGHVVWVESVNGNGTINLTEYNNWGSSASHMMGDFGARNGVPYTDFDYFIYFDYF